MTIADNFFIDILSANPVGMQILDAVKYWAVFLFEKKMMLRMARLSLSKPIYLINQSAFANILTTQHRLTVFSK